MSGFDYDTTRLILDLRDAIYSDLRRQDGAHLVFASIKDAAQDMTRRGVFAGIHSSPIRENGEPLPILREAMGFGLKCARDERRMATITIVVHSGPNDPTQTSIEAKSNADPAETLDRAIRALQAERAALAGCPMHAEAAAQTKAKVGTALPVQDGGAT